MTQHRKVKRWATRTPSKSGDETRSWQRVLTLFF